MTKILIDSLNIDELIALKKLLAKINNTLTQKLALAFVDFLAGKGAIHTAGTPSDYDTLFQTVRNTNPNARGFDIRLDNPSAGYTPLIAEVKTTVPVFSDHFGSQQEDAITTDLNGLTGQSKKGKTVSNLPAYYKFMVFFNSGPSIRQAAKKLIREYNKALRTAKKSGKSNLAGKVVLWEPAMPFNTNDVFVVILDKKNVEAVRIDNNVNSTAVLSPE